MAITISGENNNDRILASDGVIDQISGINIVGLITASHINVGNNIQLGNAGIITATTFIGNLTGNVNSTSPLLLQTDGGERFRITGNNELGIAGANYGTSGQVLTSGGSGSAVSWTTIPTQVTISTNANNRVITGGSGVNLNGEVALTFDGATLTVNGTTNDTPLILTSTNVSGSHMRFQLSGSNKHFVGCGGGFGLGDVDDLSFRTVDNLIFGVGTSEKLRIGPEGNLALGGTNTSAYANQSYFFIGAVGSIYADTTSGSGNSLSLSNNAYINTSGNWVYRVGDKASNIYQYNGDIGFRTAGTGSAGNTISWSEKLRIDSNGKVGISSASPVGKFDVTDGTTRISFNRTNNTPRIDFKSNNVADLCQIKAAESLGGGILQVFTKNTSNNSIERLRITSAGKIGIGTDNPRTGLVHVGPVTPLPGSAFDAPLTVYATGALGGNTNDDNKIATFAGAPGTGNVSGLSVYQYRRTSGSDWTTDGFSFRQEVDNTENVYQYMNFASGKVAISKTIENLTGNGFDAALQVNNKTTNGYGTIMMGGGYNRATIGIGAVYDLIIASNAYPANATTGGIKFRCGTSGGGGPHERLRIHQDGMLESAVNSGARTYHFANNKDGNYSNLVVQFDCHNYASFMIDISVQGYPYKWAHARYQGYLNGGLYGAGSGPIYQRSHTAITLTHSHVSGQIQKIVFADSGGTLTHPSCDIKIMLGAPSAYIDTGDISFTWS